MGWTEVQSADHFHQLFIIDFFGNLSCGSAGLHCGQLFVQEIDTLHTAQRPDVAWLILSREYCRKTYRVRGLRCRSRDFRRVAVPEASEMVIRKQNANGRF